MHLLLLLLACGDKDPADGAAADDTGLGDGGAVHQDGGADGGEDGDGGGETSTVPDLPTQWCDGPEHAWLPLEDMGGIVAVERDDEISLDAETIDLVLDAVGFQALTPVPYGIDGFKVRYLTQDQGQQVEATGFMVFPAVDVPTDVPALLWTHPTYGFNDTCAPSAQGVLGGAYAMLMAAHGFAVAAPDYLGMAGWGEPSGRLHPWVVPEPTAVASLDALRALAAFTAEQGESFGVQAQPDLSRTVIWGASEGGFAALWADRYQAEYLPEVDLAGVVAAIPPTDPAALAGIGVTGSSATTQSVAAVLVTAKDWHDSDAALSEALLAPLDETLPESMATECEDWEEGFLGAEEPQDIYTAAFIAAASARSWEEEEPWGCYLESGVLRNAPLERGSAAPVLLITGEEDQLAWPEPTIADIPLLCDQGYEIEHVHCAGADHTAAGVESLPYQLQWALSAAEGATLGTDCVVSGPVDCTAL